MNQKFFTLLTALAAATALNAQTTFNFNYTGTMQTFTVPMCVTSINVDVNGAAGGSKNTALGGLGGKVTCTIPVTPGEVLQIYVGGKGQDGDNISGMLGAGYNGGGHGWDDTDPWGGAGGGGASDIRRAPFSLNDRLVVAGGGGGGGIDGCSSINMLNGGAGGGLVGANGDPSPSSCVGSGQGGTQTAGGLKGQYTGCNNSSFDGVFGFGGDGYGNCSNSDDGGSGGGGGWYGGGAGNFGAGGGGSSYTSVTCTAVSHTQGSRAGDGIISITCNAVSFIQSPSTVCSNSSPITLTPGNPSGGTFSGLGVVGNTFDPSITGTGTFYVVYTYTDGNSCTSSDSSAIIVQVCTGVLPVYDNPTAHLYPNPFSDHLTVELGDIRNAEVFMFNLLGENVGTWKTDAATESIHINTSTFKAGVYFITIRSASGTFTRKLVKE